MINVNKHGLLDPSPQISPRETTEVRREVRVLSMKDNSRQLEEQEAAFN